MRVERSLDTLYGPPAENDPKRASSRRPAVLLPPVVAVLNVHPRVAQMSMGHGSFDTTMKYYTGVSADLQKQAAEALGELLFGAQNGPAGAPTPVTLRQTRRSWRNSKLR